MQIHFFILYESLCCLESAYEYIIYFLTHENELLFRYRIIKYRKMKQLVIIIFEVSTFRIYCFDYIFQTLEYTTLLYLLTSVGFLNSSNYI